MSRVSMIQLVSRIKLTHGTGDFRTDAALAAASVFGREKVLAEPLFVNASALANALGEHPVVHELHPGAIEIIANTDLHSLPGQPPLLLDSAFVLTGINRPLFGDTIDLGVYPVPDGGYGILGMDWVAGEFLLWHPTWEAKEIVLGDVPIMPGVDIDKLTSFGREAIRFLMVYALLLEADKTPIEVNTQKRKHKRSVAQKQAELGRGEWIIKRISLTTRRIYKTDSAGHGQEVKGDRILAPTIVSGHLAYQAYGKQWSLHRWIYVDVYEARRWIAPGPKRIIIGR